MPRAVPAYRWPFVERMPQVLGAAPGHPKVKVQARELAVNAALGSLKLLGLALPGLVQQNGAIETFQYSPIRSAGWGEPAQAVSGQVRPGDEAKETTCCKP